MVRVVRRPNESVDSLIRRYAKARNREDIPGELKKRESYWKPCDMKRKKHNAAIRNCDRRSTCEAEPEQGKK